jgi:hypothetical protein
MAVIISLLPSYVGAEHAGSSASSGGYKEMPDFLFFLKKMTG